ncbi:MAG: thioredoxin-related protein [Parasphingorhabdus sp.]|jgi:thioredoxin-related protein
MTSPSEEEVSDTKKHFFDHEKNVRLVVRALFACCALLAIADFFVHRHISHAVESLPGFYAFYGFVACVVLVLVAKEMRKLLMRDEDYYDSVDD